MEMPVEQSAWAIAFAFMLFMTGLVRGLVWLIQYFNEKQDRAAGVLPPALDSGLAPHVPSDFQPQWLDFGLLLAVGMVCMLIHPLLSPIAMIVLGVVLLQRSGVEVLRLWQWNPLDIGHYLLRGTDRYLVLVIPMTLITVTSMVAYKLLGGAVEPQPIVTDFLEMDNPRGVLFFVLLAVVIAPIWEELVFRGILYPLLRGLQGRIFAVLVTGILFGLVHAHGPAFIPLTALGCALAWCYEKTGKLGYCMGLHAAFNGATAIMLLLIKYAPNE